MDTHVIGGIIAYMAGGIFLGLVFKSLWDKWNKNYITQEQMNAILQQHIENCATKSVLTEVKVVKKVVLKLAARQGLDVKEYEDLTE